jgi:hypothetical protein
VTVGKLAAGDRVIKFGKHRGSRLGDIPEEYLRWLLTIPLDLNLLSDVWAVLNPGADVWAEFDRAVDAHGKRYKAFQADRVVGYVRRRGWRYAAAVLVRGVSLASKQLRKRESFIRYAQSMD